MRHEKDLIHFHTLMESVRKYRNITIEELCHGLCSVSQMHYIQRGDRLPDYLMRNRIMGRLGISSEGYEDYVQFDEYERWEEREKLIEFVEDSRWSEARNLLDNLFTKWTNVNMVEKQFLLDMKARILMHEGGSDEYIFELYNEIVSETIGPNLNFSNRGQLILSPVEIYYVVWWLLYMPTSYKSVNEIIEIFDALIVGIENSYLEAIAKAKVLPFAVFAYQTCIERLKISEKNKELWNHTEVAINILKKTERFYYLKELVSVRYKLGLAIAIEINYIELEQEVVAIIENIKDRYDIGILMFQSGYIYRDSIVNCIAEVIHNRRRMLGITRTNLADGVCSLRTLERIEACKSKPQQEVMKGLFEKLGLLAEYRRAEIVTDDIEIINAFIRYRVAINQKNLDVAFAKMDFLIEKLDCNYVSNKQAIIRMLNVRKKIEGQINEQIYVKNIETALSLSVPYNISNSEYYYLTDGELVLLYSIATHIEKWGWQKKILDVCNDYQGPMLISHFPSYELIKDWEASELGNHGDYDESNSISEKIIRTTFRLHRFHGLYMALYNVCWNNYEKNKTEVTLLEYNSGVLACKKICDFCENKRAVMYQNMLK